MLLKALHIVIRAFLVVASAFWLLIVLELLPVAVANGMDGMRDRLLQIWSIGGSQRAWSCQDSLHLVHDGYTDIILFLILTWASLELKRFVDRRMQHRSRLAADPAG
jgi:hypothetical protein